MEQDVTAANNNLFLLSLCNSADKKLSVLMNGKNLETYRNKYSIIEFRLKEEIFTTSDLLPIKKIKKIFIPISGKHGLDHSESRINFLIGNISYLPYLFSMNNKKVFRSFLKMTGLK